MSTVLIKRGHVVILVIAAWGYVYIKSILKVTLYDKNIIIQRQHFIKLHYFSFYNKFYLRINIVFLFLLSKYLLKLFENNFIFKSFRPTEMIFFDNF